jgi:hypothetical protein
MSAGLSDSEDRKVVGARKPKGTLMPNETLKSLQTKCSITLNAYLDLAKAGCELLCGLNERPLSESKRNEILSHRRQELHAHANYTKARSKLWEFLNHN